MRSNLDGLLQRYTENHPDVTGARRTIRELEEQRRQLLENYRKAGVPLLVQGAASGPRASEQIKISLSQAEAQVASLRARVGEYSTRYAELRDKARRMPEYEAELAQLNRDYEVNKRNYESLVSRREQANLSGDMQSVAGVADFRLIDPPRVSPNPVFPNRPLLLVVTLILSLLAGGGVMFASKELRPCIYEPSQLRDAFGLPLLGVVSFIENDASKAGRVREMRSLGKVAFALGVSYVVVVVAIAMFARAAI
jgi:polysaccharide chain length determinant protein (PEP-CTERM system associated)